ncbi:hypothetical protein AWV79_24240 [Cupriavidus sp. UYMMa02A]|nr:hypothetical protein AWV79_24240 [Cupriavidus sp. UYMMa02A]
MSRYLQKGNLIATPNGERLVKDIWAAEGVVELLEPTELISETVRLSQLRAHLAAGNYRIQNREAPIAAVALHDASNAARKKEAENRSIFAELKKRIGRGATAHQAICGLLEAGLLDSNDRAIPLGSERTLYRILARGDARAQAQLPQFHLRGNHGGGHSDHVVKLVLQLVEEQYAKVKSRFRVPALAKLANQQAHAAGLLRDGEQLGRKFVRKVLVEHWHPDLDYRRLDPRLARSAKAVAKQRIRAGGALHRTEDDTLHLPFVTRGPGGAILAESWLMLIIDCFTAMPLSWRLMKKRPTVDDTLACLERAMFPKRELFVALNINCPVDPYGTPIKVIVDNGPENKGERVERLTLVGINVERAPAHSGHRKPFIERLHGALKSDLEVLPGCTRFNGKDGERMEQAKEDDLMTFEELERWIVRWLYEQWANRTLERFITADYHLERDDGITPMQRWMQCERTCSIPNPPDRDLWNAVKLEDDTRSLSPKTGIPFEGFRFRGENLPKLVRQYGPNANVRVFYSPVDYRFVYVPDKDSGRLLMLINDEVTEGSPASILMRRNVGVSSCEPAADSLQMLWCNSIRT